MRPRLSRAVLLGVLSALAAAIAALWLVPLPGPASRDPGASASPDAAADERACQRGAAWACVNVAAALSLTLDPGDSVRAAALYRQACDGGLALACVGLAQMAIRREVGAEGVDAGGLLRHSCAGGDATACLVLGDAIRAEQLGGTPHEATAAWGTACGALLQAGCISIGRALRDGWGGAIDLAAAGRLFAAACDAGHPDGCAEHATMVLRGTTAGDPSLARDRLERACYAGSAAACVDAIDAFTAASVAHGGDAVAEGSAEGARERLRALRERGCALGVAGACEGSGG